MSFFRTAGPRPERAAAGGLWFSVDRPLIAGATPFGIGWGLGGHCPGPAIASIGFGNPEALWFLPAMLAGAALQRWRARPRGTSAPAVGVAGGGR